MTNNLPVILNSIIAALAVITTAISVFYQTRLRKLDHECRVLESEYKHLRSLFENFLEQNGLLQVSIEYDETIVLQIFKSFYTLIPYLSLEEQGQFSMICEMALMASKSQSKSSDYKTVDFLLSNIVPIINQKLSQKKFI